MESRLKTLRKKLRMSQTEFAHSLGVSTSAVGNWESGFQKIPEMRIEEICTVHGINRHWLETGEGGMFGNYVDVDDKASPYSFAKRRGCDDTLARVFDAVLNLGAEDQAAMARLIRKVCANIEDSQQKQQHKQILESVNKIIAAVNYAEGNIVQRGNQSNSASLSNDENSSNGE